MRSGTVRTICTSTRRPRRADRRAGASPRHFVPAHAEVLGDVADRRALRFAQQTSCQPTGRARRVLARVVAVAGLRGQVDPADERNSIVDTIVFSWWQCSGRSFASSAHSIRVFSSDASSSPALGARGSGTAAMALPPRPARGRRCVRPARQAGSAAPGAHRPARARSPVRSTSRSDERASAPAAAPRRSPASACAPSIRTSTAFPGRAGGSPAAQPPAGGASACSQPILRSRRR